MHNSGRHKSGPSAGRQLIFPKGVYSNLQVPWFIIQKNLSMLATLYKKYNIRMAHVAVCVTIRCKVTYCRPRSNFEMFVSLGTGNYNDTMGTCYTQDFSYHCYAKHLKVISVECHENYDVSANFEVKEL